MRIPFRKVLPVVGKVNFILQTAFMFFPPHYEGNRETI